MSRSNWYIGALAVLLALVVSAPARAQGAGGKQIIMNEDVMKLVKAGFTDEIVLLQIKRSICVFDMGTDALILLKEAKVSEEIVKVMLTKADEGGKIIEQKVHVQVQFLRSPDLHEYNAAIKSLAEIKPAELVAQFLVARHLKESSDHVRAGVCEALGKLGSSTALTPLMHVLRDHSPSVRLKAAAAISLLKGKDTVDRLLKMLSERNNLQRDGICIALGYMKDKRSIEPLLKVMSKHETAENRAAAAFALGLIPAYTKEAREALIEAITKDQFPEVRANAASALCKIDSDLTGKKLTITLSALRKSFDRYSANRVDILKNIEVFKDGRVILLMIEALNDRSEHQRQVRRTAWQGLKVMTGENYKEEYDPWNAWWDIKGRMRFPIDDLNEILEPDAASHPALIGPKTGEDAAVPKAAPEAVAKP